MHRHINLVSSIYEYIWRDSTDFVRSALRDFTLMITVFLRTHWSSFCSCEHLSFSGLDIITHGHYRRVNFFTLSSHSTQNCRWLRSGSLVEFTVSAYWDDVYVAVSTGLSNTVGFLVARRVSLHRRAGSCWRVPFEQQRIHRYTDINAPIICDFANVYHDPMTISFSWTIVCCSLC